ncbi:MAG: DUF427 domain-containing protein [Pseudomonadota bacterium]
MTDATEPERPVIRPASGRHVVRAGGAVLAETDQGFEVTLPGAEAAAVYLPRAEVDLFLDEGEGGMEIPGLGHARLLTIVAKSGPITGAAWVIDRPAEGAEALDGHVAFDAERVAVERL